MLIARLRDAKRRVTGPLDRSAFGTRGLALPRPTRTAELTRLSLYRLGLSGTFAKYRVVPRSAIVGFDELQATVRAHRGDDELHDFINGLWQRHGAPSREIADTFLDAAARLDRSRRGASPAELGTILGPPCSLVGAIGSLRKHGDRVPIRNLDEARERLLEAWLHACAPRSAAGRARDNLELAVCLVFRRARQYAVAAVMKFSRPRP